MVKILLFGVLASEAGLKELEIENVKNTKELLSELDKRFPVSDYQFQVFVNREQVAKIQALNDGDEVALIPPFPGG
ncbi:MAG: MoaD/ThiS family protein [Bacteroidales bacterium]|nr:MoaD/ThiS family protein [Bacteroidales bacterium]